MERCPPPLERAISLFLWSLCSNTSLVGLVIFLDLSEPPFFQYCFVFNFLRKGSCGWCCMYSTDKTVPAWEKCSIDSFKGTYISLYITCRALCFIKEALCLPVTAQYTFGRQEKKSLHTTEEDSFRMRVLLNMLLVESGLGKDYYSKDSLCVQFQVENTQFDLQALVSCVLRP